MTDATPTLDPWSDPEVHLQALVDKGRLSGSLTMEQVIFVLRMVELTPELIEAVRERLRCRGHRAGRVGADGG